MAAISRVLWRTLDAKPNLLRQFVRSCCVLAMASGLAVSPALGDEFNPASTLYRQLLTPMTSVIDGKPFREAIGRVAQQSRLNVWIDRRVDPTALVHPGELGPTVHSAIKEIAAQRDCVVMPVAEVLLVGRPQWVDATAYVLIELTSSSEGDLITVTWEDLTTPNQALRVVSGDAKVDFDLPHDLWPAVTWNRVDRNVALAMVLAQFDQRPTERGSSGVEHIQFAAADSSESCKRRYRPGKHVAVFRQALKRSDRAADVQVVGGVLEVQATAAAHRLATDALLERLAAGLPAKPSAQALFSLNLRQRAGEAIRAFAAKAGRRCLIDPNAEEACETIVTLQAKEKSLRELSEMVAREANLLIQWGDDTVKISRAP